MAFVFFPSFNVHGKAKGITKDRWETAITCDCIKTCDSSCLRDGCGSGRAIKAPPSPNRKTAARSLSGGAAIAVFTFGYHFCPWGIWMWNEIFRSIVWFICYIIQLHQLGSLKDGFSAFRTCPLGVRQPIGFLLNKRGRFVWALQYVLLEGFRHAEFLSRDRGDKPWGNEALSSEMINLRAIRSWNGWTKCY